MTKINYKRKLLRMLAFVFPVLYLLDFKLAAETIAVSLLVIFVGFDVVRLSKRNVNELAFKKINILKEKEKDKVSSITWFLLGVMISLLAFPKEIAILSMSFTIIGDAMAEVVGVRYRKIMMLGKSLEGNLACFVSCLLVGWVFSFYIQAGVLKLMFGALAATIAQALPLKIDDNLSMPLLSAIAMFIIT